MIRPLFDPYRLFSALIVLVTLLLSACSGPPPAPPLSPSEELLKARELFKAGDWDALKEVVKGLPSTGPFAQEGYFYLSVTKGIKHPKYGLDSLRAEELKGSEELRAQNQLYQLIFQGLRGECLLALGPLKSIYAPELDAYPSGTKRLIQSVLRDCDERRADQMRQLSADLKEKQQAKAQPLPEAQAEPTKGPKETVATTPKTATTMKEEAPAQPVSRRLSVAQLQEVTPHIALFLPKKKDTRGRVAGQLLEVAPIAKANIERSGKPITIEIFEPQGPEQLTEQVLNLDARVQLVIAFTLSSSLHRALIEASRAQARPVILLTPHPITRREGDLIWRLFTTTQSIAKAISLDAIKANAKRALLVTSSSLAGQKLARGIEEVVRASGLEWAGHEVTPKQADSDGWSALAQRIRQRPVDTLIMALSSTQSAQLMTYLAAEGVWSAKGAQFESELPPVNQTKKQAQALLRTYLWPSSYEQRALKQAGRYLEGARLASPVYLEGGDFKALSETLREEINRDAHIIDPLLIELITSLDQPLRESLIQDQPLSARLKELTIPAGLLPALSFQRLELMGSLRIIEVSERRFVLRSPRDEGAPVIIEPNPAEPNPAEPSATSDQTP